MPAQAGIHDFLPNVTGGWLRREAGLRRHHGGTANTTKNRDTSLRQHHGF
jgi:hypothetical protein